MSGGGGKTLARKTALHRCEFQESSLHFDQSIKRVNSIWILSLSLSFFVPMMLDANEWQVQRVVLEHH